MFKKLTLKNFQNHTKSTLLFHPGVNVISGPSDNGKSSIIRALRLVLENKAQGDSYRKIGTDKTSVKLELDGHTIERIRSKKENEYVLDGQSFKAVRSSVPDEISGIINLSPSSLQSQFDPYFLLSDSPGEVAKKLNELADISIIDKSIKAINSKVASAKSEIKFTQKAVADIEDELLAFDGLNEIEKLVNEITELHDDTQELVRDIADLQGQVDAADVSEKSIAEIVLFLKHETEVNSAEKKLAEVTNLKADIEMVSGFVAYSEQFKFDINRFNEILKLEPEVTKADEMFDLYDYKLTELTLLQKSILMTEEITDQLSLCDTTNLEDELKELWKENPVCPVCEQKVRV